MKTLKKPQVIIFDWDNTLAENRDVVVGSMNKILAKYGKEEWEVAKKKYRDNNKSLKDYIKIEYMEDGGSTFIDKGTIQNILDNNNGYVFDNISVAQNETSKVYFNFVVIGETPNDLQALFLTINELTLGFAKEV